MTHSIQSQRAGSPQPDWLIGRERLSTAPDCGMKYLPRAPERTLWRIPEPWLEHGPKKAARWRCGRLRRV